MSILGWATRFLAIVLTSSHGLSVLQRDGKVGYREERRKNHFLQVASLVNDRDVHPCVRSLDQGFSKGHALMPFRGTWEGNPREKNIWKTTKVKTQLSHTLEAGVQHTDVEMEQGPNYTNT